MKKNVLMILVTFVLAVFSTMEIVTTVIGLMKKPYSVDQYRFNDGYTITVDWNQSEETEYKNIKYYYGCINDHGEIMFWWTDAAQWYEWIYEHIDLEGGETHEDYLIETTEWRW